MIAVTIFRSESLQDMFQLCLVGGSVLEAEGNAPEGKIHG